HTRWPRDWSSDVCSSDLVLFRDVIERSARRHEEESAAARPELNVVMPESAPPPLGYPLLVALHGNNSTMADTVAQWSSPASAGRSEERRVGKGGRGWGGG